MRLLKRIFSPRPQSTPTAEAHPNFWMYPHD